VTIDRKFKEKDPIIPFDSFWFIWIFIFLICVSIAIQYLCEQDHNNKVKQEIKVEQEKAKFI